MPSRPTLNFLGLSEPVTRKLGRLQQLARYHFRLPGSLPDFLIVGAQKGGTTSLYTYLAQHPNVVPAIRKEIHFFESPANRIKGARWYRSYFPTRPYLALHRRLHGGVALTGEATPYMRYRRIPRLVHAVNPDAKLIFLLRDPIDRAFSHYMHIRRSYPQFEPLSFSEAIRSEADRIADDLNASRLDDWHDDTAYRMYSYVHSGLYAEQLRSWLEFFPRNNVYVRDSETFFQQPDRVLDEVTAFLGLHQYRFDVSRQHNTGGYFDEISAEDRAFLRARFLPDRPALQAIVGSEFGSHWLR